MEKNKVTTYLLYAVGEILLVVIGILIAVSLNNWNAQRIQKEISDQTYASLIQELKEAKQVAMDALNYNQSVVASSGRYIAGQNMLDTVMLSPRVIFAWTNYQPVSIDLPVLFQEIGSNRLILQSDSLREQLRAINSANLDVKGALGYLDEFWNSQVASYFIRTKKMILFYESVNEKQIDMEQVLPIYQDEEHRNLCAMSNLMTMGFNRPLIKLIARIDDVLAREQQIEQ